MKGITYATNDNDWSMDEMHRVGMQCYPHIDTLGSKFIDCKCANNTIRRPEPDRTEPNRVDRRLFGQTRAKSLTIIKIQFCIARFQRTIVYIKVME